MSEFLTSEPKVIYGQLNHKTTGVAISTDATVYVIINGGEYQTGAGTLTHKGHGLWQYLPHSTEANSHSCVVHFVHSDAISDRVMFYATPKRIRDLADPTAESIAIETQELLAQEHGAGSWEHGETSPSDQVTVEAFSDHAIRQLGEKGISISAPVLSDGTISLVQGDDYFDSDLRSLIFSGTSNDQWPDLGNSTVTLFARQQSLEWQAIGEVVSATGQQQLRFQLTSNQTNQAAGWWDYQIKVTLQNDHNLTLASGRMHIALNIS